MQIRQGFEISLLKSYKNCCLQAQFNQKTITNKFITNRKKDSIYNPKALITYFHLFRNKMIIRLINLHFNALGVMI